MARFGRDGLLPASLLARRFRTEEGKALLAGVAAHAMLPLTAPVTSAFGLVLMMAAHAVGWPVVEGGSVRITDALVAELTSLGGSVETGRWVGSLARAVLLDVTPRQLLALAGDRLPARHRSAGAVPVRSRGLQGRLGAERATAMAGGGLPRGRHSAPGRHAG